MPHSPEPWKIDDDGIIVGSDGSEVCDSVVGCRCHDDPAAMSEDDKDRIVACVNFCRDIPTEWMQGKIAKTVQVSPDERPEDGWRYLALIPNLLGLIPVCKEPPHP